MTSERPDPTLDPIFPQTDINRLPVVPQRFLDPVNASIRMSSIQLATMGLVDTFVNSTIKYESDLDSNCANGMKLALAAIALNEAMKIQESGGVLDPRLMEMVEYCATRSTNQGITEQQRKRVSEFLYHYGLKARVINFVRDSYRESFDALLTVPENEVNTSPAQKTHDRVEAIARQSQRSGCLILILIIILLPLTLYSIWLGSS